MHGLGITQSRGSITQSPFTSPAEFLHGGSLQRVSVQEIQQKVLKPSKLLAHIRVQRYDLPWQLLVAVPAHYDVHSLYLTDSSDQEAWGMHHTGNSSLTFLTNNSKCGANASTHMCCS